MILFASSKVICITSIVEYFNTVIKTTQLKTIGESLGAINAIQTVLNRSTLSGVGANKPLALALAGYSTEAIKAAVIQKGLNEEQIRAILYKKRYRGELLKTTTNEWANAASTNAMATAEAGATTTTTGLSMAFKGLGASLKALVVAHPVLTAIAAGIAAVAIGVKVFDAMLISVDEAKENLDGIKEKVNEINNTYKSHADLVSKVAKRYDELSKGVNLRNNENFNLSDEDYKEFLDITNQLADAFPKLQRTLDANGNSVLTFADNSKTATGNLRDLLKAEQEANQTKLSSLVNDEMLESLSTVIDDAVNSQIEYNTQLAETEERIKRIDLLKNISGSKNGIIDLSVDNNDSNNSKLFNTIQEAIGKLRNEFEGKELEIFETSLTNQSNEDGTQTTTINTNIPGMTSEMKQKIQNAMQGAVDYFNSDVLPKMNDELSEGFDDNKAVQDEAMLKWLDIVPSLVAKMKNMPSFQTLGDEVSEQVSTIFSKLDYTTLKDVDTEEKFKNYIYDIIKYINTGDNKKEFQNAYAQLISIDPNDGALINKQKIDRYSHQIAAILHEDVSKIKLAFGFDEDAIKTNAEQAADDVAEAIKTTISSTIDDLNKNYKPAFDALQKSYQSIFTYDDKGKKQFSLDDFDLSSIESIKSALESMNEIGLDIDTKTFEDFVSVLSDSSSTATEVQDAFDGLATEVASSLNSVTGENAGLIESFLESMGVINAHEVVQKKLAATTEVNANKSEALKLATKDMADGIWDSSNAFAEQAIQTNLAKVELADLIAKEDIFASKDLGINQKVEDLNKLAEAYFGVSNAIATPSGMGNDSRYGSVEDRWANFIKEMTDAELGLDTTGMIGDKKKTEKKKKKKSSQDYDFIEPKLERASNKFQKKKDLAEDETRTDKKRLKSYKGSINQAESNIALNEKAYKKYMDKAEKAGKKGKGKDLSADLIKKIQNGSLDITTIKDEKLQKKIEGYQKWWEKARKCKEEISDLNEEEKALARESQSLPIETSIRKSEKDYDTYERANNKIKDKIQYDGATSDDYSQMNTNTLEQIKSINEQIELQRQLQAINAEEGTEAWDEYDDTINNLKADIDDLTNSMEDNAIAASKLINDNTQKAVDTLNDERDLLNAKLDNANGASDKNGILDGVLRNLEGIKEQYEQAVRDYEAKLAENLTDDERKYFSEQYSLAVKNRDKYNETSKTEKNDIAKQQFDNIANDYDSESDTITNAMNRHQRDIDKFEAKGIGQSKRQYEDQIQMSQNLQKNLEEEKKQLIAKRDAEDAAGNLTQETYDAMTDKINSLDEGIDGCVINQLKYNSAIEEMDLSNLQALADLLDKVSQKYDNLRSLRKAQGGKMSDDELFGEIEINTRKIENANSRKETSKESMKSDLEDLGLSNGDIQKMLAYVQAGDGDAINQLLKDNGIDQTYNQLDDFKKHFDEYTDAEKDWWSYHVENEGLLDEFYDNRIDQINEYIDALQKEKDIKDRTFALEKARFDLEKAKNNLTKKVWNGEQWVYTSDKAAVRDAQKNLDDTVSNERINGGKDFIDMLEDWRKNNNMYDKDGNVVWTEQDITKSLAFTDKTSAAYMEWAKSFNPNDLWKANVNIAQPDWSKILANINTNRNMSVGNINVENNFPNINDQSSVETFNKCMNEFMRDAFIRADQFDWDK